MHTTEAHDQTGSLHSLVQGAIGFALSAILLVLLMIGLAAS
jgi:hypothetical protein